MKNKSSSGLWLLMIIAPIAVFGIFKKRPDVIVDSPRLIKLTSFGEQKNIVGLQFFYHNFSPGEVETNLRIVEGGDQIYVPDGVGKWQNGRVLAKIWFANSDFTSPIIQLNQNRHQTVKIQLDWKTATQAGSQTFVITPQMKP